MAPSGSCTFSLPHVLSLLLLSLPLTGARHNRLDEVLHTARTSLAARQASNSTLEFTDAVIQEARILPELQQGNFSEPVTLPGNLSEITGNETNSRQLQQFASLFPALPQTVAEPDFDTYLAEITPPQSNGSEAMQRRQSRLRVLAVGDSMTHCNEGDFTWRYRLWEWFRAQGKDMEYVGPYPGPAAPPPAAKPGPLDMYDDPPRRPDRVNVDGAYAAAAQAAGFVGNHFAISGRSAAVDKGLIRDVVANYPADIMLVMLGFNDLGWFFSDDDGLLVNMKTLIDEARQANPRLKIVIGTVPHRTYIGGRQDLVLNTDSYNRKLKESIPNWSTSSSLVTWAPVREEFECGPSYGNDCPAAYDGLHPNERGEYQIARAFSRTLVSVLGIGSSPLAVPAQVPARPLPAPSNFRLSASELGVTATWDKVFGAYQYDVVYTINGGGLFKFSPGSVNTNRWDSRWAADGWVYEVYVCSSAGNRKGGCTGALSATARPQTASAPTSVSVSPLTDGFSVSWDPSGGPYSDTISHYQVYWWDLDTPCAFLLGAAWRGTTATLRNLVPGHRYFVAIESFNAAGAGFPYVARTVRVNHFRPSIPTNLKASPIDSGAVHLTWDEPLSAAGYMLYRREAGSTATFQAVGLVDRNCADQGFQFPGVHRWEWVVTAINGQLESSTSSSATSPQYDNMSQAIALHFVRHRPAGVLQAAADLLHRQIQSTRVILSDPFFLTCMLHWEIHFRLDLALFPDMQAKAPIFAGATCTGDVTDKFRRNQAPRLTSNVRFVTLSIGGNDIGFSDILKFCVYAPNVGLCNFFKRRGLAGIRDRLQGLLEQTYDDVFSRINSNAAVIVQLYPSFFNDQTTWCNDQRFSPPRWYTKPALLTQELRRDMNDIATLLRDKMKDTIDSYVRRKLADNVWSTRRMWYLDGDNSLYNGARFCELNVRTLERPDIGFFTIGGSDSRDGQTNVTSETASGTVTVAQHMSRYDPAKCDQDTRWGDDGDYTLNCGLAREIRALGNVNPNDVMIVATDEIEQQTFHPKTWKFEQIGRATVEKFDEERLGDLTQR